MPDQLTDVNEIKESGILLKASREHVIRVLGAFKTVARPPLGLSKEEEAKALKTDINKQYHAGSIQGTQEDPEASPLFPRTPSLHVTADNRAEFLKRDVT